MNSLNQPITVPLDYLRLDHGNPRLADPAADERMAILGILKEQKEKLVRLAEHIAKHGLSPSDLPIVFPMEDGKYTVAEGNRRIASLKILNDLSLIQGAEKSLVKSFSTISARHQQLPDRVVCALIQSEAERVRWITLRHTGQNEGRGLVGWDAIQQARYNTRHQAGENRMEFGLKVVELVRARGNLTPDEENVLRKIPITTLERMLGDPDVRDALGIERSLDGVVGLIRDDDGVVAALKALTLEIARKDVRVGHVMKKDDRATIVAQWPELRKPGLTGEPATAHVISHDASSPASQVGVSSQPSKRFRPRSPDDRKVLIPPATLINIPDKKVKRVLIELKKLEVEQFGNAVAVLLRVFLELSVDAYLHRRGIKFIDTEKLRIKMDRVSNDWETSGALTKPEIKAWRNASCSNDLFSLNVLHAYVHSRHAIPKKQDLIRTWDEMELFFKKLWP